MMKIKINKHTHLLAVTVTGITLLFFFCTKEGDTGFDPIQSSIKGLVETPWTAACKNERTGHDERNHIFCAKVVSDPVCLPCVTVNPSSVIGRAEWLLTEIAKEELTMDEKVKHTIEFFSQPEHYEVLFPFLAQSEAKTDLEKLTSGAYYISHKMIPEKGTSRLFVASHVHNEKNSIVLPYSIAE